MSGLLMRRLVVRDLDPCVEEVGNKEKWKFSSWGRGDSCKRVGVSL